ncbi:metal-sensitive transcriptional regulator [Microbacterium luticocti]|uniref:metal-sensitive transcriptional regulator n=1 Tax=Microbacterium luticocti TaxID=451764 RepID=UPI000685138D|nr:metal-sensitive transcriptional regulator [Microbacterium luticocti]
MTTTKDAAAPDVPADALEQQRKVLHRLRRARGQLDAVIRKVEEGGSCREVVTQLAAVTHALNRAGFTIVATAMQECLAEPVDGEGDVDRMTPEELEKVFLSLA